MEEDLKRIVNAVLGTIVFMFVVFSAIAILSSRRVFGDTAELTAGPAKESVLPELAAGIEPDEVLREETLAAVVERPH